MSWTRVVSKHSGFRWDVFPFGGMLRNQKVSMAVSMAGVTSFYVSEFPDFCNAKRLFELFGCSGNVVEVAISPRRNSVGKRFAFARFVNVEDGRILAIRLDNILIEGKKIHVNLPRFNRVKGAMFDNGISPSPKGLGGPINVTAGSGGNVGKGNTGGFVGRKGSYAASVSKGQVFEAKEERLAVLDFQSDKGVKNRFNKAYVGRVCLPGTAYNVQNYLEMEGIFAIKVTPLGGNCCLLEDLEDGFIGDLIKEGDSWWKSLFSVIEKWDASKVDGGRDVWLRIYGVPLHVWCPEFFVALGEAWGRFICLDANTSKGENLDVARIMVNVPISLIIPEVVSVCIDGAKFNICVREDMQCALKQGGEIKKSYYTDSNSSDSFDSESDRLLEESVSGGSDDGIEQEGLVGINSGDSKVRLELGADNSSARSSGAGCAVEKRIEKNAPFIVGSGGKNSQPVESVALPISAAKQTSNASVSKMLEVPVAGYANLSEINIRNLLVVNGGQAVKDGCGNSYSGGGNIVGSEVPSESPMNHSYNHCNKNTLDLVIGSTSNSVAESVKRLNCGFGTNVGETDLSLSAVSGRAGGVNMDTTGSFLSDASKLCIRPRSSSVSEEDTNSSHLDAAPKSLFSDGLLAVVNNSVAELGTLSGSLAGFSKSGNCYGGDPGLGGRNSASSMVKGTVNSLDILKEPRRGVRSGGKFIRKVRLEHDMKGVGRDNMNSRRLVGRKVKGVLSSEILRDNSTTCYGDQSEESDILRNNGRQWDLLKREVGERLWEAMSALGVVDRVGMKLNCQGLVSDLGGRMENAKRSQ